MLTDLHASSMNGTEDMMSVMSKMLNLGLSLEVGLRSPGAREIQHEESGTSDSGIRSEHRGLQAGERRLWLCGLFGEEANGGSRS